MSGPTKQVLLALALLAVLAAGEARRHEESAAELRPHRHRHRHELSAPRWSQRDDSEEYADESRAPDYDEYSYDEYPDEEEEYAERRPHAPRRLGQHRRSEPRYQPARYRHRGARTGRPYEAHSHHRPRPGAHRKPYDERDDERDDEPAGYHHPKYGPRRRPAGHAAEPSARRSTYEPRRHRLEEEQAEEQEEDDYAYDADDEDYEAEEEERGRGNRSRKHASRKGRFQQELPEDRPSSPRRSSSSKLDEWLQIARQNSHGRRPGRPEELEDGESELWKDEDLDNDFYKNDAAVTFDDIIRRLTEERSTSTTSRPTAKRNAKAARSHSFGAYEDLQSAETRRDSWPTQRSLDVDESKRKSLEEHEDNAGEGGEDEVDTKDDNTDYVDDENDERSTATTTTTTSTTTTQRPVVASNRFKSKQSRNYEAITTGSEYNGYQAKNNYPPMSEHSAYKWQYLGTAEGVKKARINSSQFGRNNKYLATERDAAHNNVLHVAREGSCQWPRAKVMQVRDVYPNLTGTYTPRCVILHRCSDDTGCCSSETLTCEAKRTQQVELYFYVLHTISNKNEIEKLTFENHTECECGERKDNGPVIERQLELRNARHSYYSPPQNIVRPKNVCRCPTEFNASQVDGVCECTCSEQSKHCKELLQGKGFLAMTDRNCIEKEQPACTAPKCDFGEYDMRRGACPRKKQMFHSKWHSSFRRGS